MSALRFDGYMAERLNMENFAKAEKLVFRYGEEESPVLDNIDLVFKEGEFTAILGHNGCGKSTFAKHLNAILLPSGGRVYIDGIDTKDESRIFDVRQKVGMVFQNPDNQIVATIVEEDVAFALENLGVEPAEIRRRVDEALEPTAMLDPAGRKEVMATVRRLNEDYGITIILITHYMEEAAQCRRVIVMDKGRVLLDDTPREVFSRVELIKSVGLDVPQVTELVYELNQYGLELDGHIITEDECADMLIKLIS